MPDPNLPLLSRVSPNEVPTPLPLDQEPYVGQLAQQEYPEGYNYGYGSTVVTERNYIWDGHHWLEQMVVADSSSSTPYVVTVPYGIDPIQYTRASPEERIALDQRGAEMQNRDINQDVIAAAGTDVLSRYDAVGDEVTAMDATRLAQEDAERDEALAIDAAAYQNLAGATSAADNRDYLSMGMLGQSIEDAEGQTTANLEQLRTAGDTVNATDILGLQQLERAGDNANAADAEVIDAYTESLGGVLEGTRAAQDELRATDAGIEESDYAARAALEDPDAIESAAAMAGADPDAVAMQQEAADMYRYDRERDLTSQAAQAYPELNARLLQEDAGEGFRRYAGLDVATAGDEDTPASEGFDPDIVSREAVAYADPDDIAAQRGVLDAFGNFAAGEGDIESARAGATADQRAVDAQYDALGMFRGRADPAIGAQERLMFEQARRAEENDRRSAIATILRDLRERGVLGGGAEVSAYLGTEQTTSQNRMLADMMALAAAEARAERNTGYYADLASGLRTSSFGEDAFRTGATDEMALADREAQLSALSQQGDLSTAMRDASFGEEARRGEAWDEMAIDNRDSRIGALEQMADLGTTQRTQSYDEMFRAGEAADDMTLAEWDRQADATNQLADLGTTMREQGFGEQLQAGTAADAMAQFNTEQSQLAQRYEADYIARQNEAEFARQQAITDSAYQTAGMETDIAGDIYGAERDVTADTYGRMQDLTGQLFDQGEEAFGREQDIYGAYDTAIGDAYARDAGAVDASMNVTDRVYDRAGDLSGTAIDLNAVNYTRDMDYLDSLREATGDYYGRTVDYANAETNLASLYTDQGQAAQAGISQAYESEAAQRNAEAALEQLEDEPDFELGPLSLDF